MKRIVFLLLITQTIFYSHTADNLSKQKNGIRSLISASKKTAEGDQATNARLALDYLCNAQRNTSLKPGKKVSQTLTNFGVDKNHLGGILAKVMDTRIQMPVYRFSPTREAREQEEIPTIRGKGRKMTTPKEAEAGAARAPKKSIDDIIQEAELVESRIQPGQKYFHYKNPDVHYTITAITTSVATQEPVIHYTTLYNGKPVVWSRDFNDFISFVTESGTKVTKFRLVI